MIHPIAGKCKHCKADLSAYRSARPAAAAPLPALNGMPALPYQNGHSASAAPVAAVPQQQVNLQVLAAQDTSQPILPPRPTGRMHAAEAKPSAWRSWPVVVIVLAMLAIVTAVVLMVWPAHKDQAGKHALQPPPAPERMDTNQLQDQPIPHPPPSAPNPPGAGGADPWSQPHSQIDPPSPPAIPDQQVPNDPDVDDLKDPFTPGGSTLHAGTGMATIAMVAHLCKKLTQCGTTDVTMKGLCDSFGHNMTAPSNCPAAERCIEHIDTMSCGDSGDITLDAMSVMTQFHDCAEAIKC